MLVSLWKDIDDCPDAVEYDKKKNKQTWNAVKKNTGGGYKNINKKRAFIQLNAGTKKTQKLQEQARLKKRKSNKQN